MARRCEGDLISKLRVLCENDAVNLSVTSVPALRVSGCGVACVESCALAAEEIVEIRRSSKRGIRWNIQTSALGPSIDAIIRENYSPVWAR